MSDLGTATLQRPRMPFTREDVLHISPMYARVRSEAGPIAPVLSFAGDPAWLVTGYEEARTAFSLTAGSASTFMTTPSTRRGVGFHHAWATIRR